MAGYHFALIGGAHPHSIGHLRTLQELPEVDRVTIVDPDSSVRDGYSDEAKVVAGVASLDVALESDATHVYCCARNDEAPAVIEQCARAGRHIMAEKPLGLSAEHFEPARRAVAESGVTFGVAYTNRYSPSVREAQRILGLGVLGQPVAAEARMITSQVKFRNPAHWLFSKGKSGGGILSWLACHYLDLLVFLLEEEPESVCAHVGTLTGEAIDVEDVATVSIRFQSGLLATMTAGYLLALSPRGYYGGAYTTHVGIYGTQGRLTFDLTGSNTVTAESSDPRWASAPRRETTLESADSPAYGGVSGEAFVRRFLHASEGDGESPAGLEAGVRILRLLDAIYRSASGGTRVSVAGA